LIPALQSEELEALEDNIVADGCRDALITWNGTLIDGHNRLDICERHGIPYKTLSMDFIGDRDDVMLWIIRNQFARRNLTPFQHSELAIRYEHIIAAKAKERQREHGGTAPGKTATLPQNSSEVIERPPIERETRTAVARLAHVSHDTIRKAKVIIEKAPEALKAQLRTGDVSINAAYQQVKQGIHYSSATPEWSTPQDLFDVLNAEFNFTLDVCATPENAKCEKFFTPSDDGLSLDWYGTCWMNPPYGDEIDAWMRKAINEAMKTDGPTVVCLVPARVDTNWWWDTARYGQIRFLRGRLKSGGSPNSAPFPSAVVVFPALAEVRWWEWRKD
jgi:phage N-6-adenine-methyltransferase